jgi:hypothetical protein
MNYYDTLIEVADDCPVAEAHVPRARGSKQTKGSGRVRTSRQHWSYFGHMTPPFNPRVWKNKRPEQGVC